MLPNFWLFGIIQTQTRWMVDSFFFFFNLLEIKDFRARRNLRELNSCYRGENCEHDWLVNFPKVLGWLVTQVWRSGWSPLCVAPPPQLWPWVGLKTKPVSFLSAPSWDWLAFELQAPSSDNNPLNLSLLEADITGIELKTKVDWELNSGGRRAMLTVH